MVDGQGAGHISARSVDRADSECQGHQARGEEQEGVLTDNGVGLGRGRRELFGGFEEEVERGGQFYDEVEPEGQRGEAGDCHCCMLLLACLVL